MLLFNEQLLSLRLKYTKRTYTFNGRILKKGA